MMLCCARRRCCAGLIMVWLGYAITLVGAQAQGLEQPLPSTISPGTPSQPYLLSVDVALSEADPSMVLGIREGQTIAQAAAVFCAEHGFGEELTTMLMPQLMKVLEEEVAAATSNGRGDGATADVYFNEQSTSVKSTREDTSTGDNFRQETEEDSMMNLSTAAKAMFSFDVSLDGLVSKSLAYYAWQDPADTAAAFCAKHIAPSETEYFATCAETLRANIVNRRDAIMAARAATATDSGTPSNHQEGKRETQQQPQSQRHHHRHNTAKEKIPWLTVPLNINGIEANLKIFEGMSPRDTANDFCSWDKFGLASALSLDSCVTQVSEITLRAISAHKNRERESLRREQEDDPEPFTFSVPVSLAGLTLFADFRADERPRVSAQRFCRAQLPKLEAALGAPRVVDDRPDDDNGWEEEEGGGEASAWGSRERQDLVEACAQIVESAINAILLGLRDLVREAEMAQANATKHHQGEHNRLREKTEGWKNEDELSDLPPSQPLLDSVLNAEQVQTSN